MSRVGTIAVTQIFTSVKNWVNSKLPTKVSDLTNDSGFLTQHPSISTSTDTTSSASPSANGTFTCIDSVTRDTNGHVTKVNTKTITLPKDTTYSGMTASEATTGTSTTNRLISPKVLEDKITAKISNLVNSAPSTLDTLDELANALGDDPNFATTIATQIGNKANDNAVVHLSSNETISGTKVFKSDKLISTSGNSYRIINNSNNSSDGYGVFQRIDSGNWYLMLTAKDDALGSWTSARPASMNLSTGVLSINGNASTATQFSANKDVTLTGDVTGTASSKAGWSVATTLANSGVTAGTYGPSADVTGNNNATISVPEITVDAKGRVTSVTNRTLTCKNNTYNVYNKTLTIQKNGTNVATFTSNSNTDVTANITVPTKTSELTNDSGFLTSHQSLANYLTKTTNVSEMGRYIDLHYDNATSKYDYDARLYVDSQGTAAGGGSFKIAAASAYAPAPASNANDTRIATTAWVNSKGYLTSHPSITLSTNTTSTASPAHGGTFTCIDSVTQDTNGHITKVNTKTITLPADNNTDTKVTQTVTTANSNYPVLLCATANATETGTTTSRFSAGLAVNARYSSISMTNKYDTANTKGVRDSTKGYLNGDIIFKCYDDSEMGRIHCESSKNGYQQTYMQARSYIKNGAISPEGTATTCYITVRVRDNGSKTIYTDGSWENSLTPYANETYDIGTSSLRWMRCYCKNFYGSYVDIAGRYLENEYSTNARTCLYLKSNRDTDGQSGIYFSKFRQNRAQGALTGSDLVDLSLDVLENSVRTNSCISISFRYFENNVPTKIYFIPKKSMTSYMGTADNPWTNAYITNLILNGNAFDPASVSGNIGDIVFACAYYSSITGTTALELTVSGNVLYLAGFDNTTLVINSSSSSLPGTWKFLGTGKPTTTSGNADTKRVGLWKRIA